MLLYLLIGGNQGDRLELLVQAKGLISNLVGTILRESNVYETAPWGFEADTGFLNMALLVDSNLSLDGALAACQKVEATLGRVRKPDGARYASRPMDVDIIFADRLVVDTPHLTIPHPRMQDRRFVLVPLNDLDPSFIHPVLNKSLETLLRECPDTGDVEQFLG